LAYETFGAKAFSRLVCDADLEYVDKPHAVDVLRNRITRSILQLGLWKNEGFDRRGLNRAAYALRQVIEASTAAMLLRVDPLRVLVLCEAQRTGSYELHRRNLLALQWQGDVLSDQKTLDISGAMDPRKIDRALFSIPHDVVIWTPAIVSLLDKLAGEMSPNSWQVDAMRLEPEEFVKQCASQLNNFYSLASKEVHVELLTEHPKVLDPADIRQAITYTVKWLSLCGLILSVSRICKSQLTYIRAASFHSSVENMFGSY
jgi:hypothetical protein